MSYTLMRNTWEKKSLTLLVIQIQISNSTSQIINQPYFGITCYKAAGTNRVASASSDYTSEGV